MSKISNFPPGVSGHKGGKGGGGASRAAVEAPNTLQSRATARVIDIVSHGECIGLADRANPLRSVFYDGLPIENTDGTFNWQGIEIQERLGLPGQDPFLGFDEIEDETVVNLEITQIWPRTIRVTDNAVDALRVKIRIPALTKQNKENGDMNGTTVAYRFEARVVDGAWSTVALEYLSDKCTTPQELSYRIERPDNAIGLNWEMRVVRITPDTTDITLQNKTYLATITQLIDAKLQYADLAGLAQLADSAQFGDKIPPRAYDWVGLVLDVPSNYIPPDYNNPLDPATRQYPGLWDGTFKRAWTDNPAWVLWGLLTNKEWGLGRQISAQQVDKWELYQIAKYCDEFVPNGYGGFEPRYRINTQITKAESAYATLQAVASIFRGMLYWGSGTVSFVCDQPKDAIKLVSPANVIDGEFTYTGTSLKNRHTVARVTWNDPTDNFVQAIEVVEDPEMIDRYGYKPADVTAYGCISRGQANRMGRWLLDTERYETEAVTYRASFDHADVRPGQIVKVFDPHYSGVRMSGRIIDVTNTSVEVDAPVEIEAGQSYTLSLVREDGSLVSRTINNSPGSHTTLTWSASVATLPQTGSVTIFATATATQRSTIVDVTSTSVKLTSDLVIDPQYTYFLGFTLPNGSVVSRQLSTSTMANALANGGIIRDFTWSTPLSTLPSEDSVAFLYAPAEGFSQRTVTAHTPTTATISSSYEFKEGYDYEVMLTYSDDSRVFRKLTNTNGASTLLTWSDQTNSLPIKGAMWGLTATDLAPREFRVLGVKEVDQNIFEVTALNYDRNKYARVEQGLFLDPPGTSIWTSTAVPAPPTDIQAYRRPMIVDGVLSERIHVFWAPSVSPMVTHYRIAYKYGDGEFVRITDSYTTGFELDSKGKGDYTFVIAAVNIAGKESQGAVKVLTLEGRGIDEPAITNLRVVGQNASVSTFIGSELKIAWDVAVPDNWWTQLTPEGEPPAPQPEDPTANSWEDPYLKDYVVKVKKLDGTELRTFYTRERTFTLDRDTNAAISDNAGRPRRAVQISVALRDVDDVIYEYTSKTFNNPVPAAPSSITLDETMGVVSITVPRCPDFDYASTRVWISETENFDPLVVPHVFEAPQTQFVYNGMPDTNYYVRVAYLDTFSNDLAEMMISSQFYILTSIIDIADEILDQANANIADAEQRLQDLIDAALAAAAAKARTFRQALAPSDPTDGIPLGVGDLWIDSDDNNKLYRWNGTAWENTTPAGTQTFAQDAEPTGAATGDLWFDTDDNMKLYRYSGSAWVVVTDGRISDVYNTVIEHTQTIADLESGKASVSQVELIESVNNRKNRTFAQAAEPVSPVDGISLVVGDLWLDTDDNNKIYRWDGAAWSGVNDARGETALAELAVARGSELNLAARLSSMSESFTNALTGKASATEFSSIKTEVENARGGASTLAQRLTTMNSDIAGKAEASTVSTLSSSVSVRNRSFTGTTQPTDPSGGYPLIAGDLWMDSSNNNVIYRWTGSSWVLNHDQRGQAALDEVTAARGGETSLSARITQVNETITNGLAGKASASSVNDLYTEIGGATPAAGTIKARLTTTESVAVGADGMARSIFGVTQDVNGYVTGFSSVNNGASSSFTIRADKFGISAPGGGARTEYSNGNWRIYDATGRLRVAMGVNI